MAEKHSSNVLSFGGHDVSSGSSLFTDAPMILTGCRDRLAQGVATVFAQHLGSANDDFLSMADRATSLEQQQLYFAAMDFLANSGHQLLQQFRSTYVACFDEGIAALRAARPRPSLRDPDELRLIDTDDFERDLAIGKLSARATCNCSQQLTGLDRRLGVLLRLSRISQDDNPLYPRTLFSAMLQSLTDLDVGPQLALILLQEFERQTSSELPGIYADLNRYLVQSGVLPTVPLAGPQRALRSQPFDNQDDSLIAASGWSNTESADDPALADQPEHALDDWGMASPHAGPAAAPSSAVNEDLFAQLALAIQAASLGRLPRAAAPAPAPVPAPAPYPSTPEAARPSLDVAQLIDALNGLQRGRADTRKIPGLGSAPIDPGHVDVLQQIRSTPMVSWSHPVDALTIDIVAMLFDTMFSDSELSPSMRAEIAKLQIPVLKVALMDKAFFSDKQHPARRLLDVIASSGIGRSEKDEPRLIDKIRSIVDAVVTGFESDIQIFAVQVQKLEEFLHDEDERAQSMTSPALGQLQQHDRKLAAVGRVGPEVERRINRPSLPPLIVDFLTRSWRLVLMETFVRAGDTSVEWNEALRVMDELLWTVEPKNGPQERDRLLSLLPDLLKRLRGGLALVAMEESWDAFFGELIRLHMAALHREMPAAEQGLAEQGAAEQDAVVRMAPAQPAVAAVSAAGPAAAVAADKPPAAEERPAAPPPIDQPPTEAPAAEVDQHLRLVQALEVGAWVEFQSLRGTRKTLRLSWISEFRGVYLFTNRQGENALSLATTSLASHLRKGTARLLSQDPLTERAVAHILDRARAAPASPSG